MNDLEEFLSIRQPDESNMPHDSVAKGKFEYTSIQHGNPNPATKGHSPASMNKSINSERGDCDIGFEEMSEEVNSQ